VVDIQWVNGSTLTEIVLILLAFVLSATVGIERHRQVKSAGLRTHTLVGVGSALFTLVSAYGFATVDSGPMVTLDPTRIAAQIVSGIGFLGAGVIFVRRNAVSGLTTAASIWLVAAIGMASGAGMPVLAIVVTILYVLGMALLSRLARVIPVARRGREVVIHYKDGRGVLRSVLRRATEHGFEIALEETDRADPDDGTPLVTARLRFHRGRISINDLVDELADIKGIKRIDSADDDPRF